MSKPFTLLFAACTLVGGLSTADAKPRPQTGPTITHQSITMSRGRLGAQVIQISDALRAHFAAPAGSGLLVDRVLPASPAAKAGMRTGDVIVAVEGKPIAGVFDIHEALSSLRSGDKANVKVIRNKKARTLQVTLDSDAAGGMSLRFGPQGPNWDSDPFFRGMPKIPFGPSREDQDALKEQMRRLEERLDRLEGRQPNRAPKATPSPKTLKGASKGTGKRS